VPGVSRAVIRLSVDLDREVEMIRHPAAGMHVQLESPDYIRNQFANAFAVRVAAEDLLLMVAAQCGVAATARDSC
jgi:hypothetical protein